MSKWIITPDKYLTTEEIKRLRNTCQEAVIVAKHKGVQAPIRDSLIIELALGTGLRVSELSQLRVEDLSLKKGQTSLVVKNRKGKDRIVQFGSTLKNQILEYLDYRCSDSPFLFISQRGEHITRSGIQKVFKKWARNAGIGSHHTIRSLRHTYATNLYKASGYNLRLVQKQLGHANISTTNVYRDAMSSDLKGALENKAIYEE